MTDDLLRRAAVRAQELAGDRQRWEARGTYVMEVLSEDPPYKIVAASAQRQAIAALIAACDPPFLRDVGELLAWAADRAEHFPPNEQAVAVARALLDESE